MFIVFQVDEDGDVLAVKHTQSKVTIVFQATGPGPDDWEPVYGLKEIIGFKDPEVIDLPSCFTPREEILIAIRQWVESSGQIDTVMTDEDDLPGPTIPYDPENDPF